MATKYLVHSYAIEGEGWIFSYYFWDCGKLYEKMVSANEPARVWKLDKFYALEELKRIAFEDSEIYEFAKQVHELPLADKFSGYQGGLI